MSNPLKPVKLSEHWGDRGGISPGDSNDIHSAFAWDTGPNAYVVVVDNFETSDVDILDITKPKRPRLIREMDLDTLFPQILQTQLGSVQVNLHDVVVKQIGGRWVMLLSYGMAATSSSTSPTRRRRRSSATPTSPTRIRSSWSPPVCRFCRGDRR